MNIENSGMLPEWNIGWAKQVKGIQITFCHKVDVFSVSEVIDISLDNLGFEIYISLY